MGPAGTFCTMQMGTVSVLPSGGKANAEAAHTETSCSHCESMSLACLHLQIAFFSEGSPPCSALTFPFSPKRKKQRTSGALTSGSSDVMLAQLPRTPLSPHLLVSPVCFTQEDQHPSLASSGVVSFCISEEEIAVDDSMSFSPSFTICPAESGQRADPGSL